MDDAPPKPRFGVQFMHIRERLLPVRRGYMIYGVLASVLGVFGLLAGEDYADLGLGALLLVIGAGLGFVYRKLYVSPAFWTRLTAWIVTLMVGASMVSLLWTGALSLFSAKGAFEVVVSLGFCSVLWDSVLTPEMDVCIAQNEEEWRNYITKR